MTDLLTRNETPGMAMNNVVPKKTPDTAPRLLGAHMPTAGGLYKSLVSGKAIGCTAVQLFTGSPKQWSHPPLTPETVAAFRDAQEQTGITFTTAHDSYLINLAAPTPDVLDKSKIAFRSELDRAHQLGIPWLVTHMGAHLNQGEDEAMARLVDSLKQVLEETDKEGYKIGVALETTAGQGTGLGWRFEQLGQILREVGHPERLGVCLDTCHIFAAGYDLCSEAAYEETVAEFDRLVGLANLKVIHANDSQKGLGCRVDRHAHIGDGCIGLEAFERLVRDPRVHHAPVIIETPESETMHAVNLARLRDMVQVGQHIIEDAEQQNANEAAPMNVTVQFFGHYSDYYPQPLAVTLALNATIRDLTEQLAQSDTRLSRLAAHCRFAVGDEYATLDQALKDSNTVAVLPPMSGG